MKKLLTSKIGIHDLKDFSFDLLKALGVTTFCVSSLFIASLCATNGDLTFYSPTYLSFIFLIYALLSMGLYFAIDDRSEVFCESKTLHRFMAFNEISFPFLMGPFFFVVILNIGFIPLMLLSGLKERLPLSAVLLTCFLQLLIIGGYQFIMKIVGVDKVCKSQDAQKEPISSLFVQTSTVQGYESVIVSGALNPLAECILEKIASCLSYVVLLDQDALGVAALKSWLNKKYPKLVVVTSVVESKNILDAEAQVVHQKELESFFKTYKPEIIFDLDRFYSYTPSQMCENNSVDNGNDFPPDLIYRNITLPRILIDLAREYDSQMVLTLSGNPLLTGSDMGMESLVEATQTWLECYAQRQDGTQTRVVPLRCHQPWESTCAINIILDSLWKKFKKDICFSSSMHSAESIVGLVSQLLRNPTNHGGIWALTSILLVKRVKLQKFINSKCKTIGDVRDYIKVFLSQIPVEILKDSELTETSLLGAALVKDTPLVDVDFDKMMLYFEPSREIIKDAV